MPFQKNQVNLLYIGEYTKDRINYESQLYPIKESLKIFKYMKFQKETNQHLNVLVNLAENISNFCGDINYFSNLTTDGYYHAIMSDYFRSVQFTPGYSYSDMYINSLYNLIFQKLDKNFYSRINSEIEKKNIIIISDISINNDINVLNKKVIFKDYIEYKLPISYNNKLKYVFMPNQCYIKFK
jgi:hypothetical protein